MKAVLRCVAAILAGLVVLFVLLIAVEFFSAVVHPFPPEFGGTKEEMCRHVERYPAWVLAVVVPLWGMAAFVSTWTGRRIGNIYSATIVGLLLLAALVCNLWMLPYPTWFKIANLFVIPGAVLAGGRSSNRHKVVTGTGN